MTDKKLKKSTLFGFSGGLMGIQFIWSLVIANMSGIFALFSAKNSDLGLLWVIPSVLGLIFSLLIGYLSDITSTFLGKRLPYVIAGTVMTATVIIFWPFVTSLVMAAVMLCLFTISINTSQQPFRALVIDIVSHNNYTNFYAIQTVMIGIGATLAFIMPWILKKISLVNIHVSNLPPSIVFSFFIGAFLLILSILYSVLAIKPYLSTDEIKKNDEIVVNQFSKTVMHKKRSIIKIFVSQFFIWLGTFGFFIYLTPEIGQTILHVSDANVLQTDVYRNLIEKSVIITGLASAVYTIVSVVFAYLIPVINKIISRKIILTMSLLIGGISLSLIGFIHQEFLLFVLMIGIGIAWASFNSIPFAFISDFAPSKKIGFYMGLSNVFVCLPQILVSLFIGILLKKYFRGNIMEIMLLAGVCYWIAAVFIFIIKDVEDCDNAT